MTSQQAARVVLVAGGVMGAVSVYSGGKGAQPGSVFKQLWGVAVLTLVLSVGADFAPGVVVPFSVAVVVGYLIRNKQAFGELLGGRGATSYTQGGPPGLRGPVGEPRRPPDRRRTPPGIQGPIG